MLTDRGRSELGPSLGSGVRRLDGRLLQSTDSLMLISVESVEYIDAPLPARWSGEQVQIARHQIASVSERRISGRRTALAAALAVGFAVLVSLIAIEGFGLGGGDDNPGNGDGNQT